MAPLIKRIPIGEWTYCEKCPQAVHEAALVDGNSCPDCGKPVYNMAALISAAIKVVKKHS